MYTKWAVHYQGGILPEGITVPLDCETPCGYIFYMRWWCNPIPWQTFLRLELETVL